MTSVLARRDTQLAGLLTFVFLVGSTSHWSLSRPSNLTLLQAPPRLGSNASSSMKSSGLCTPMAVIASPCPSRLPLSLVLFLIPSLSVLWLLLFAAPSGTYSHANLGTQPS